MRAREKTTCTSLAKPRLTQGSVWASRGRQREVLLLISCQFCLDPSSAEEFLVLGPKPELMSCSKLSQTGLIPDFQLAFDRCVAILIDYK